MTVCPKHRAVLRTWWIPTLKCYHPLHGNKRRKPEKGASLQMYKDIMTKWKVLVPVGAGMFLFSFFGEAKMDTRGTPCLAKNDTALKPAINSRSPDTVPLNEKHFNWKFIAEYGKSYFITLSHNTTQKLALLSQFRVHSISEKNAHLTQCVISNATSNCKYDASAPLFKLRVNLRILRVSYPVIAKYW